MNIKMYTDEKYVPISQMQSFDSTFIDETINYRQTFNEMIKLDDLHYVNLVETPSLIKKRFIANMIIKDKMIVDANESDYVLEIAKAFVNNKTIKGIKFKRNDELKKIYKENNNDLTIVTNYIAENIEGDSLIEWSKQETDKSDIQNIIPELSKFEKAFVEKYNIESRSYTLHDFQELNNTSYETARKSLDKLKKLKLYIKNKVGKKFVYSPTQKLIHIINGGA